MSRFTVFGREGCGFCRRAKEILDIYGREYHYIDIHEEGISKADLEKTVGKPVETVPQVFYGRTHIGGFTELEQYLTAH